MAEEEKTYASMREMFYKKYRDIIVPVVQNHEATRIKKLHKAILCSGAIALFGTFLLYLFLTAEKRDGDDLKAIFAVYFFAYATWYGIKKRFENTIKEEIMPTVCSCFDDLKWHEGSYTDGDIFSSSCLISPFDSDSYDDIFNGSYHDVSIDIVESKYTKGHGKNSTTVFDGVIVKLDMNKKFSGHTIIRPDGLMHSSPSSKLHHTELEDPEFNKKFDVFTDDEVEARYLITPTFMERLKNMEIAFNASTARCSFYNSLLIIGLPTKKDLFSICSLVKPIDDRDQYVQMYDEIESIVKLIDHFKLNQRTGL